MPDRRWTVPFAAGVAAGLLVLVLATVSDATITDTRSRVVFVSGDRIGVMNADGSGSRLLAQGTSPTWSPNGSLIAFETARVPRNGLDIYLMNADGTDQRRMVGHPGGGGEHPNNTADDFEPAWSPATRTIAFTTNRDGNNEIYTMDVIGHSVQRVTDNPASDSEPAWSPDGERIAFVSNRSGSDEIYVVDRRQTVTRLTTNGVTDRSPAWSPDRRQIAFQSLRDGNWELYVMDANGGNERRLTASAAADTNPTWSPAGELVYTTTDGSGTPYLAVLSASGDAPRRLTPAGQAADQAEWQSLDDISLSVRHPRSVRAGARFRVRIAVRNKTAMPSFNAILTSATPRGARVVSARARGLPDSCVRADGGAISCWIPRIGASSTVVVDIVLRARRCGLRTLGERVSSGQADVAPRDNRSRSRLRVRC